MIVLFLDPVQVWAMAAVVSALFPSLHHLHRRVDYLALKLHLGALLSGVKLLTIVIRHAVLVFNVWLNNPMKILLGLGVFFSEPLGSVALPILTSNRLKHMNLLLRFD